MGGREWASWLAKNMLPVYYIYSNMCLSCKAKINRTPSHIPSHCLQKIKSLNSIFLEGFSNIIHITVIFIINFIWKSYNQEEPFYGCPYFYIQSYDIDYVTLYVRVQTKEKPMSWNTFDVASFHNTIWQPLLLKKQKSTSFIADVSGR